MKNCYHSFILHPPVNNNVNAVGSVGFLPRCLPLSLSPVAIVRVDPESGEPVREPRTGHCIRCEDGKLPSVLHPECTEVPSAELT